MVPLKMPVKSKPGVQLICIEQIGITPPRIEYKPQCSSFSELDRCVRYGTWRDDKTAGKPAPANTIDIEQLSNNFVRLIEQGGKAMAAYLKPREEARFNSEASDEVIGVVKTFGHVAEYWFAHPRRALEIQADLGKAYFDLWASATKRMFGEHGDLVAKPDPKDRRFADPEWSSNPFFDFLRQTYLLTSQWASRLVKDTPGVDPHTRQKAEFYVRQFSDAFSPANFVLTNPELLRETVFSNAGNLVRGTRMLAEDIEAGRVGVQARQSADAMLSRWLYIAHTLLNR